ncbi:winged helix-turn-helix domain-containing protein [Frankia sp. AgPm24]|uniref:winged helix-turn-helix domain-containing protein n=1 Tax=Frankia sp. AgPm24 TaxID=631128 RepID=UPI0025520C8D|nr:winged helix-turn-helix domain-containing protein [Frankia sp. AgPm24]
MRYATGGGLTAEDRDRRERVRREAADLFENGALNREVAAGLRVSERSVERWRRRWKVGGVAALRSRGPTSRCRLDEEQLRALEAVLDRGPAASGWVDERWTLARIREVIVRMFGVEYTLAGVWLLLDRRGWSCQVPVRRAVERDEGAVGVWREQVWERARK